VAVAGIQENFRAGGRTGPGPFGGGSEQWKKSRRVELGGGQTRLDTGLLAGSISYRIEGNSFVLSAGPRPGAAIHHLGGIIRAKNAPYLVFRLSAGGRKKGPWVKRKFVTIPARPYLTLGDDDVQEMLGTLVDFYNQLIGT
jgi:phage gpG-like protein